MKNYVVRATRYFKDKVENKERQVNDEFYCTKKRYEFLKANNAVELVQPTEQIEKQFVSKKKKANRK